MAHQCMFVVEGVNINVRIVFAMTATSHHSWNIIQVEDVEQRHKNNLLVTSILHSFLYKA